MRGVIPIKEILSVVVMSLVVASCADDAASAIERLRSPDEPVRYSAAVALGAEGLAATPEIARALRARLDDPSERVRVATARALARSIGRRAISDLARLCDDQSIDVRRAAAGELTTLGGDEAIPPLLSLLQDRDPEIRAAARQGLVELGLEGGEQISRAAALRRDALVGQAESGAWSRRLEAARGLAECGDEASLDALETLTRDRELEVAAEAAAGLGRTLREGGWPRVVRALAAAPTPVRDALLEGLASAPETHPGDARLETLCALLAEPGSATLAARAAARHRISCDLDEIEDGLASDDRETRVRAAVIVALLAAGRTITTQASDRAAEVLWSDAAAEDLTAAAALGAPPPAAADRVRRELSRYVELSQRWVPVPDVAAVVDGGSPSAEATEPDAMIDAEPERAAALQQLLDQFPPRDSGRVELFPSGADPGGLATVLLVASEARVQLEAEALRELAGSAPDPQVRAAAVWALGGGLEHLQSESPQIRVVAAEALRRRATSLDGPTKARLAFMLAEPDPQVRAAAAATLAATHDHAALRPLLAAFERWREPAVAEALGELGAPQAAPPIARALASATIGSRPELVEALLGALTRLEARGHDDAVAPFLGHPDARVRRAAVRAARRLGGSRLTQLADERRGDLSLAVREAASLTSR